MDFTKETLKYLQENGGVGAPIKMNDFLRQVGLSLSDLKSKISLLVQDNFIRCMDYEYLGIILQGEEQNLENKNIIARLKPEGLKFYSEYYLPRFPTFNAENLAIINGDNNGDIRQETKSSNKIITTTINEKEQWSIKSIVTKYWWAFIVPIIVGVILLAIEQKWFAINK